MNSHNCRPGRRPSIVATTRIFGRVQRAVLVVRADEQGAQAAGAVTGAGGVADDHGGRHLPPGPMKATHGNQSYAIPAEAELSGLDPSGDRDRGRFPGDRPPTPVGFV